MAGAAASAIGASRWSALPLRLIVGAGFLIHGYLKLSRGIDVFYFAYAWMSS